MQAYDFPDDSSEIGGVRYRGVNTSHSARISSVFHRRTLSSRPIIEANTINFSTGGCEEGGTIT